MKGSLLPGVHQRQEQKFVRSIFDDHLGLNVLCRDGHTEGAGHEREVRLAYNVWQKQDDVEAYEQRGAAEDFTIKPYRTIPCLGRRVQQGEKRAVNGRPMSMTWHCRRKRRATSNS